MKSMQSLLCAFVMTALAACAQAPESRPEQDPAIAERIAGINRMYVFADMHAHPSRFHRANVPNILPEEVENYRRSHIDLFAANISTDMAWGGGYTNADGSEVERGEYRPEPGQAYALTADRLQRIQKSIDLGYIVLADTAQSVIDARENGQISVMPALEGGDALEGDIENLFKMHQMGLRLIQLVHFRANALGHIQTYPYSPGGLTEFGREVVRESNRLGIVIDLAHANNETIMDTLALSEHPIIFSHGGVKAFTDHDRAVTDQEIRAIAEHGGVIGIWPHGRHVETVEILVDYIEHVIKVGGIDHVGIGSDLRGVSAYSKGFDGDANFRSIAAELLKRGHSDDDVGKVMGGNFFRVWTAVSDGK